MGGFTDALVQADSTSLQATIEGKGERLFALLYANSPPRFGSYIALAKAIEEAGNLAAVAVPKGITLAPDEIAGFESVSLVTLTIAEMRSLAQVDVFFSPEIVTDAAPPDSATVCIPHSIPDVGLRTNRLVSNAARFIEVNPTMIRTFDYLVAAVRQHSRHWAVENYDLIQAVYPRAFLSTRRQTLDIVPGGYPKLDYSSRLLRTTQPLNTITYSPTSRSSLLGRIERDGAAILRALLSEFDGMTVVLRPYPTLSEVEYGRQLATEFESITNFAFDDSTTGIASQRQSAVVVTDSSSAAITFSLATNRPLVFVDLVGSSSAQAPTENPFGFTANSLTGLIAAVGQCLEDANKWAAKIGEEAKRNIYNPRTAATYLASQLGTFANRESHPDWLSVPRQPWVADGAPNAIDNHISRLRDWHARIHNESSTRMLNEIEAHHARNLATKQPNMQPANDEV